MATPRRGATPLATSAICRPFANWVNFNCAFSPAVGGGRGIRLDVRLEAESVWLSQHHIAELLGTSTGNIGLHLKNIYAEGEPDRAPTAEESSIVRMECRRRVTRSVRLHNLDAIFSVGYRVNSKRGTQFRIWATSVLREHLVRGYTIHCQRFGRTIAQR